MNTKKYYICKMVNISKDREGFGQSYPTGTNICFEIVSQPYESYSEANDNLDNLIEEKMSDHEYNLLNMTDDFEMEVLINGMNDALLYMYRIIEI